MPMTAVEFDSQHVIITNHQGGHRAHRQHLLREAGVSNIATATLGRPIQHPFSLGPFAQHHMGHSLSASTATSQGTGATLPSRSSSVSHR